jgi:alpha-amylase/alpha-mannosidase (GH57 family)
MRYVCVHGHFYQPPRESPALEAVELQDSAYPYHDWNERITAECYAPNANSRILDNEQRIIQLVNNYERMSFNFGPTLLSWLEAKAPAVYEAIREGDKVSQQTFGGHGSALAQAYNHMILPLANRQDKVTQVKWGISDFEHRFGRRPEGMWLPETAVDMETLEVLAENGIRFTILAPRQAKRVRRKGSRSWKDMSGDRIDPSRAYLVTLASKKTISVFFYDGPISQGVAFEGLLNDGKRFAERLLTGFSDTRDWPQLAHIATDGESYGHHHHFGEMALTYALDHIQANKLAELTNYGQFLERHPANHFVEIVENSSWSCAHGLERWRSNCGCNSGGHAGWNQEWRGPLRAALDWLRDALAPAYQDNAAALLKDPWLARDAYIRVIVDRSDESIAAFFAQHATNPLNAGEQVTALKLLEMQRHALLMYTSCGWFFDELSGPETVQIIHYAGRAVQLGQEFLGPQLESQFLERLGLAKSNLPEHGDGARIYEKWVKPAFTNIEKVAGHYAISSLFENYEEKTRVYCYQVEREEYSLEAEGKQRLAIGSARFSSVITRECATLTFGVLHLGDHNIMGGVRCSREPANYQNLQSKLTDSFSKADTAAVIRILDEEFKDNMFSLRSLFRDEQRKIVDLLLKDSIHSAAAAYRTIYENQAPLLRFLNGLSIPVPPAFKAAADIALNSQMRQAFEQTELDRESIQGYLREAANTQVTLDITTLEYVIRKRLEKEATEFAAHPGDVKTVHALIKLLEVIRSLPFPIALWEAQNTAYGPLIKAAEEHRQDLENGETVAQNWMSDLSALRENLRILGTEANHVFDSGSVVHVSAATQ